MGLCLYPVCVFLLFQEIKSNKTVLHLAVKEGNVELVRYLLRTPLPNMKDFVNLKVRVTHTPPWLLHLFFRIPSILYKADSDSRSLLPLCYRLTATQLCTWQPVSMVTTTRRRS